MPRLNRSFSLWTFALLVASVLLAWPLHEARHLSHPIADITPASMSATPGAVIDAHFSGAESEDGHDEGSESQNCAWCLFHAQHFAASGAPALFRFHAEASPPPIASPCGLPAGRIALAAAPRGPPRA